MPRDSTLRMAADSAPSAPAPWYAAPGERWTVLAFLAVGLVLRLVTLAQAADAPYFDDLLLDSRVYDLWAQEIAGLSGGRLFAGRVFYQDPLYPHLLALFYAIFGRDLGMVRVLQIGVGLASCLLVYTVGRRLFGRGTATGALAGAVLYKAFLFYDVLILKTSLEVLFLLLAVRLLLAAQETGRRRWWFGAGLALGVGALARANFLLLVPALVLWLRVAFAPEGWRGAARRWGWIALGALAGVAPATLHNAVVGGEFVLTTAQAGPNLYLGNHPDNQTGRYLPPRFVRGNPLYEARDFAEEAERRTGGKLSPAKVSRYWTEETIRYAVDAPGRFLAGLARKVALFWHGYEYPDNYDMYFMARFMPVLAWPLPAYALVSPLALLGMALALLEWRRHLLPLLIVGVYAASVTLFFLFARYRLAVVPLLLLFAAHAVAWSWRQIMAQRAEWASFAVAGGIGLFVATSVVGVTLGSMERWGFGIFSSLPAHFNLGMHCKDRAALAPPAEADARYEEARTELQRALDLARGRERGWDRAPETLTELAAIAIARAELAAARGDAAARDARMAEAQARIDEALLMAPNFAFAHWRLGNRAAAAGDLAGALPHFERALELEPRLDDARLNLAEALIALGRDGRAAAELDRILRRDPAHAMAHAKRAEIAYGAGELGAAREGWTAAALLDAANLPARRGLFLLELRAAEEAMRRNDVPACAAARDRAKGWALEVLRLAPGDPGMQSFLREAVLRPAGALR